MRKKIEKVFLMASGNIFVQGGFYLTAGGLVTSFMNYLFTILVARALGPTGFGEITTMFSYLVILSIPIGVISMLLIQKIGNADDPTSYAFAIYDWFIRMLKKWWFVLVLIILTAPVVPKITNLTVLAAYTLPLLMVFSLIGTFYNGALQGIHLFFWLTIIGIISTAVKLAGAVLALWGIGGINTVLICILISGSVPILITHFIFIKRVKSAVKKRYLITKGLLSVITDKQLWLTTGATGILALLNNVDIIYVKKVFAPDEAGIYSSWALFAKIIFFFFGPLIATSFIFFSSKKHEVKHQIVFIGSFLLFVLVGLVTNLGYGAFGKEIVDILFGGKFWSVIPYMEWASYFGTGYLMLAFMTYYFLAKKSRASLLPAVLFPLYVIALLVYPKTIADVMFVDTVFVYVNVTAYLLIFFKDRFLFLIH